jgi:hypothetical protein
VFQRLVRHTEDMAAPPVRGHDAHWGSVNMTDELEILDAVASFAVDVPHEYAEQLRATVASFRDARLALERARESGAAFGETLQRQFGSSEALRELGRVMETLSMALALLQNGPPAMPAPAGSAIPARPRR